MAYVKKRSVLPIYFIGGTWLVWAWLLRAPLYRPSHYIMAALASFIAYDVGKMLFPDRGYEVQDAPPSAQQAQPRPQPKQEQKPKSTGNPEIDALLAERDRAVGEMRRLNDSIKDVKISAQISHLEVTTGKIIDAVVEKPAKLDIQEDDQTVTASGSILLTSYDLTFDKETMALTRILIPSVEGDAEITDFVFLDGEQAGAS